MATTINHTLFDERPVWGPKAIAALLALAALILVLAWGGFPGTAGDRYQAAYDSGRFDEALEVAQAMIEENPGNPSPLVAASAALIQKAYLNQDRASNARAAADFAERAVALNPALLDGWRALGAAYQILGETARAASSYARAAAIAPNDPALLVQVGDAMAGTDPVLASQYYERALSAAPNDPLANLAVARSAFAVGNYGRAAENLKPALAESVPPTLGAEARTLLSDLELSRGNGAEAEAAAREAVALSPGNAAAKIALARALYDGIFERRLAPDTTVAEVRFLAAEALALRPSSALAAFVSFRAAEAAGDTTAAAEAAALTRALLPNDQALTPADREDISARIDFLQNFEVTSAPVNR